MLDQKDIAGRIKERRGLLRLSQAALAKRIGVSQRTIASWEGGVNGVNARFFGALADALNCNPGWLISSIERRADKLECLKRCPHGMADYLEFQKCWNSCLKKETCGAVTPDSLIHKMESECMNPLDGVCNKCGVNPAGNECQNCLKTKCAIRLGQCLSHRCPDGSYGQTDSGTPDLAFDLRATNPPDASCRDSQCSTPYFQCREGTHISACGKGGAWCRPCLSRKGCTNGQCL